MNPVACPHEETIKKRRLTYSIHIASLQKKIGEPTAYKTESCSILLRGHHKLRKSNSLPPSIGHLIRSFHGAEPKLIVERRVLPRFSLHMPVLLTLPNTQMKVAARTCNASAGGVFFHANQLIAEQEKVEFTMKFPSALTSAPLEVACRARVLRSEICTPSGTVGIAVSLEEFDFIFN